MNLCHDLVIAALARHLGVHPGAIEGRQLLEDDWGLDALDLALIVARLEDSRGLAIEVEHDTLATLRTVSDLVELLRAASTPHPARAPAVTLRASVRDEVRLEWRRDVHRHPRRARLRRASARGDRESRRGARSRVVAATPVDGERERQRRTVRRAS